MSFKSQDHLFITYTHPSEQKAKRNRQAVSSFVSRSYRPTSKKIIFNRSHFRLFVSRPEQYNSPIADEQGRQTDESPPCQTSPQTSVLQKSPRTPQPLDETLLGGSFTDPFASYPIEVKQHVPFFVDYFIRHLTPRFTPALKTETTRYIKWFNIAMLHPELFHTLIALSQTYHNIDTVGFGQPHWRTLYHRGKALRGLRQKVESPGDSDDDASILTALWLIDVDYSHRDFHAYAMHKRANERMVTSRGGIRALPPELQDELLKSEYFLPLLLHGKLVCEPSKGDIIVRYQENNPVSSLRLVGLPQLFKELAIKRLLTTKIVTILYRLLEPGPLSCTSNTYSNIANIGLEEAAADHARIRKVRRLVETCHPRTNETRLCLALLIYVFNFHNQKSQEQHYLTILGKVAADLACSQPLEPVGEREATIWTIIAVGAAASFSPWWPDIPFMGHLIEWMEDDNDLHLLTSCIRGYYLYGASKETLRNVQEW